MINYRFANIDDTKLILDFIKQLAEYEKMENEVVATEELLKNGFLKNRRQRLFLR